MSNASLWTLSESEGDLVHRRIALLSENFMLEAERTLRLLNFDFGSLFGGVAVYALTAPPGKLLLKTPPCPQCAPNLLPSLKKDK